MTTETRSQAMSTSPSVLPEKSLWAWALTLVYMSMAAGVGILFVATYIVAGFPRIREREYLMFAAGLYGFLSLPAVGVMLVARRLFLKLHWILQWLFMVAVFFVNIAVILAAVLSMH